MNESPKKSEQTANEVAASEAQLAASNKPPSNPYNETAFVLLMLFSMAFVILTPIDVLQRYPQVVPYVDWMASWNPHVHRLGLSDVSGPFADANRFCATVIWTVWLPFCLPIIMFPFKRKKPLPAKTIGQLLFNLAAGPVVIYLVIFATGDIDSRGGRFMVANLIGRSFFISWVPFVFSVAFIATVVCWWALLRRDFDVY
jgi:hypothetical protein